MESEIPRKIEAKVVEILRSSNMEEMTEYKVRKLASEQLQLDLSLPDRKKLVRQVVETFLAEQQSKSAPEQAEQDDEEEEGKGKTAGGDREYDDDGDLIICRLSDKRRVTITDFRGKTLVSIREYYKKDGKELPTSKGISLTTEQWSSFKKNVPAIEKAINKMESKFN